MGNREAYKNFGGLLEAFGQSGLAPAFDLRVISPHGQTFTRAEWERISAYNLEESVHLASAVNETELRDAYGSAVALAYPSKYEGFGLPVLEAMASGTLVATSDVSSMPEVGGNAAFYFDPRSTEAIAERLREIAALPDEDRNRRLAEGKAWARSFTWKACQQKTVDLFESLM